MNTQIGSHVGDVEVTYVVRVCHKRVIDILIDVAIGVSLTTIRISKIRLINLHLLLLLISNRESTMHYQNVLATSFISNDVAYNYA